MNLMTFKVATVKLELLMNKAAFSQGEQHMDWLLALLTKLDQSENDCKKYPAYFKGELMPKKKVLKTVIPVVNFINILHVNKLMALAK